MKKYISIILLSVLIIPSITFASWWNPLSWFNGWNFKKIEEQSKNIQNIETEKTSDEIVDVSNKITQISKKLDEKIINNNLNNKNSDKNNLNLLTVDLNNNLEKNSDNNEILEDKILDLNNKINDLQNEIKNKADKEIYLKPEVVLDKTSIKNNGSDTINIKIKMINNDGSIAHNETVKIITEISTSGSIKKTETKNLQANEEGYIEYNTPPFSYYDQCGVFLSVEISINDEPIYGRFFNVENIQNINQGIKRGLNNVCP